MVDHLHGRHQAEVGVQDGQVEDEDVRRGRVALLPGDLPDHQEVAGSPHRQVEHLDAVVENEAVRCPGAERVLVPEGKPAQASGGGGGGGQGVAGVEVRRGVEHSAHDGRTEICYFDW